MRSEVYGGGSPKSGNGIVYTEHVPLRSGLPLFSLWSFENATSTSGREPVRTNGDGTQSYWLSDEDPLLNSLLPSTHLSLVVNAADAWAAGRTLFNAEILPRACVIGPITRSRILRVGLRVRAFGAAIPAGTAMSVFGVSASALVDRVIPLAELWSQSLAERLAQHASVLSVRDSIMDRLSTSEWRSASVEQDAAEALTNCGGRVVDRAGAVLATRPATGTVIVQLLPLASGVVVRECYYSYPRAASNLYFLDAMLREVWRGERPSASDAYSGPVSEHDGLLCCFTWECWACEIDLTSGRLLRKLFTK
jgi:hypothetical protein